MDLAANVSIIAMTLLPMLLFFIINIIIGVVAVNMAKKRGFNTVPAFFAGLFGSFLTLLFIAMFPKDKE